MEKRLDKTMWLLIVICVLTVIPFLGIYDYNTKGEPRESIVSYTMIESGNWILPRNSVGEMAYKPPFFYWAVATVSAIWGEVNEFTSRVPSAVAYILLTIGTFLFYGRRCDKKLALATALVAFTSWELHRQGFNCRVDMVLTFFIVGALMLLYRWHERGMRGIPLLAVLLMSLGTLTKGPVGALLPCLVTGIYLLCRGVNFFRAFFSMMAFGLLSLVLPAIWYFAAWQQGGQEFIDLVMEENVGRMTNTMSYNSCVEPWYYNFITLVPGYLPWVILALMALFVVEWKKMGKACSSSDEDKKPNILSRMTSGIRTASPINLFSLLAIVVIFVFYCIPQSKRSVYLMPIYPFIAFFIAKLLLWIHQRHPRIWVGYCGFLSVVGLVLALAFVVLKWKPIDQGWFHGRHGFQNYSMVLHLQQAGEWWRWLLLALGVVVLAGWWKKKRYFWGAMALILAIYLHVDAIYKPAALNAKSVRGIAAKVDEMVPANKGRLYEFIEDGVLAKGDPVHYFEMNFYLHDRVANFYKDKPSEGFLMIGTDDAERWLPKFREEGYRFSKVYDSGEQRVTGQPMLLLKFDKQVGTPAPDSQEVVTE
ncbi:MAG: glycosyltransferase family 39 protein [Prevotella sp.]|nr:glycosyltransferase family 39 protein [Prevotella sp.]